MGLFFNFAQIGFVLSTLKSNYTILSENNLVLEFHSGILTAENYIEFKKDLINNKHFKANLNHFIHFKNVKFDTAPSDISEFVAFLEKNSHQIGQRKIALITNTPNQVVSTTIYKLMQNNSNQSVEIISINENALKWLLIPNDDINEVLKVIISLKI